MNENETDLPEGFGPTNYSDKAYETWKLPKADGSLLLRPLPPMKSMRGQRGVGLYWKTHFGWKGLSSDGKPAYRPFLCLEEKDYGMITQKCPACELRQPYIDKMKQIEVRGKELNKTPADIRKAQEPTKKWLSDHGLDGKVRVPCVNKQSQVGIFQMPYGIFKEFQEHCRKLHQAGHDPAGAAKGIFFNFVRNGRASFDSDSCEPARVKKVVDGEELEKLDFHALTREIAQAALDNIPDLKQMRDEIKYSYEQIEALCAMTAGADGTYDPQEVDRILKIDSKSKSNKKQGEDVPKSSPPDGWAEDTEGKGDSAPAASVDDDAFGPPDTAKPAATKATSKAAAPVAKEEPKAAADADVDNLDDIFGS